MDGYLLDTSALTPLIDPSHGQHKAARSIVSALGDAPIYVSAIVLAEFMYGCLLYKKAQGKSLPDAAKMIEDAQSYPRVEVGQHTAAAYSELKLTLAVHYLPTLTRKHRKRHLEDWVDQFTGKSLQVDDNDLWICAQAKELNLVVITGDKGMERISTADASVKLLQI